MTIVPFQRGRGPQDDGSLRAFATDRRAEAEATTAAFAEAEARIAALERALEAALRRNAANWARAQRAEARLFAKGTPEM